jgi:CRP-like cAMP-binding protein
VNTSPPSSTLEILAACFLFKGLDVDGLTAVSQSAKIRTAKAGEFFFYEKEPAETFFIMRSGTARLLQTTPEGKQVIIHLCTPGHAMAIVATLANSLNPASAEAIKDCTAYVWDKTTIRQLMNAYPIIAINGIDMLAKRFCKMQDRYRELVTERVEQRVARTLLRLLEQKGTPTDAGIRIDMPLTRQDIAQMTGTTLFTVSRILSKWEQNGLLNTERQSVEVTAPQQIIAIAEQLEV